MRAAKYIQERQRAWALRRNIQLIGSQGDKGEKLYTQRLADNLFGGKLEPWAREQIEAANGNELRGDASRPPKMQALHSSSALGVNVFQYWQQTNQLDELGKALEIPAGAKSLCFECLDYPIFDNDKTQRPPNIDAAIHYSRTGSLRVCGIECKFTEAHSGRGHRGLSQKYVEAGDLWTDIPHLREFAVTISPDDKGYQHLHPAQLIKHILGMKRKHGKKSIRLLYLWYDVLGEQGHNHRKEIEQFAVVCEKDGVRFQDCSYQELFVRLLKNDRKAHQGYVDYLCERYL